MVYLTNHQVLPLTYRVQANPWVKGSVPVKIVPQRREGEKREGSANIKTKKTQNL